MRWCILRTSGRSTLTLADRLAEDGYGTYTPREPALILRMAGGKKAPPRPPSPMMPTFVFAPADRLVELLTMSKQVSTRYPQFSVFHYFDSVPLIADAALEPLRRIERRRAPKPKGQTFTAGEKVCVTDGPAAGVSGVVEKGNGKSAFVWCGGHMRFRIDTFFLQNDRDAINDVA